MRAKVVLTAAGLALVILTPALYFHFKSDNLAPVAEQPVAVEASAPSQNFPPILKRAIKADSREGLPDRPANSHLAGVDHQTYVIERRAELTQLGMSDDPANLKVILSELENPDSEIRKTALNAAVDFGSKDALPTLQNELNWATDPQEKVDIQKAIDFLGLPALSTDDSTASTQQGADGSTPATN